MTGLKFVLTVPSTFPQEMIDAIVIDFERWLADEKALFVLLRECHLWIIKEDGSVNNIGDMK